MTPPDIIAAAQKANTRWGVPASVSIAQWKLESGNGAHQPGFNCFGIKARPGELAQTLTTTEYSRLRGYYKVAQTFRRFTSIAEAFDAHAQLLATAGVYAKARAALPDVNFYIRLMGARYATDPHYAEKLIAIIDQSGLRQFDVPKPVPTRKVA